MSTKVKKKKPLFTKSIIVKTHKSEHFDWRKITKIGKMTIRKEPRGLMSPKLISLDYMGANGVGERIK